MSGAGLAALDMRLRAELDGHDAKPLTPETESTAPGDPGPPCGEADRPQDLAQRGHPFAPPGAETAAAVAAACGPVENAAKAGPPPLTWDQKHEALLREKAARKKRRRRYADARFCALR